MRETGNTKVSTQNVASEKDVDDRADFESLQAAISKPNQVMRLDAVTVELKDVVNARCLEYSADLDGNILTPSTMTQTASRRC